MCCRYAQSVSPVSLSSLCSSVDSFATSLPNWLFSTRSLSAGSFSFVPWVLSNTHKTIHPGFVMNTITHFQWKVLNLLFAKDSDQNPWTLSFRSTKKPASLKKLNPKPNLSLSCSLLSVPNHWHVSQEQGWLLTTRKSLWRRPPATDCAVHWCSLSCVALTKYTVQTTAQLWALFPACECGRCWRCKEKLGCWSSGTSDGDDSWGLGRLKHWRRKVNLTILENQIWWL